MSLIDKLSKILGAGDIHVDFDIVDGVGDVVSIRVSDKYHHWCYEKKLREAGIRLSFVSAQIDSQLRLEFEYIDNRQCSLVYCDDVAKSGSAYCDEHHDGQNCDMVNF